MAHQIITTSNHKYSGTDAQRTLRSLGAIWEHHLHDVRRDPQLVDKVGNQLASSLAFLTRINSPTTDIAEQLQWLGEIAANQIDEIQPEDLSIWLGDLWPTFAGLHSATSSTTGKVVGIQASSGGVPKLAVSHGVIDYDGLQGDHQDDRTHHGRPWQALCIWSDEVISQHIDAGHPISRGSAGENITLSGLDWSKVRPGATLEIGSMRAQVTTYAVPCKKNARWFRDGDFQRLSHEHGPVSRVYCLVTQPGEVKIDDPASCN